CSLFSFFLSFFFFYHPATTVIYTLSLHDALPISGYSTLFVLLPLSFFENVSQMLATAKRSTHLLQLQPVLQSSLILAKVLVQSSDRKSTRLNSSHRTISYAVFCLKKKTKKKKKKN